MHKYLRSSGAPSRLRLPATSSTATGSAARLLLAAMVFVVFAAVAVTPAFARTPRAFAASGQQCPDPYPATRDPSNPLMLPNPPGANNPLSGASLFVDGPRHGAAAGAIAELLGVNHMLYPDTYSWAQFSSDLTTGVFAAKLAADPALLRNVQLLAKLAAEPETNKFSIFSGGGGPGAIFGQVQKQFCHNYTADPGAIPVDVTYFLHPAVGGCATPSQLLAYGPTFRRRVDEVAAGVANRPAVFLLETDGVGSSSCMQGTGALPIWEADLRYEAQAMEALPHTVVYLEGGYSDGNPPGYTARVLNAAGVGEIQGFYTNDTHGQWTINEIRWGEKVSRLTHGAHFIINTATNGRGPALNPHPTYQGVEVKCNPPGRGAGTRPTTSTGFANVDAFLWTATPGISSGSCHGGTPGGTWWMANALGLSARATDTLGPGYPSTPY